MFDKALNDISMEDIETVVQNKIPESRTLDYKLKVHPEGDKGNKEFLRDVSAFANTLGGYLIFGVEEKEGIPAAIKGVEIDDFDKLNLRFDNLLRMGVDPPIRGVEFKQVDLAESKKIVVVQVPKSVARPHVVKIKKHFRFYGRSSSGVVPLEVDDLRRAFLASETLATRIRTFRNDRIAMIGSGQAHMEMAPGAKIVLHLIPVSAFELGKKCDLTLISNADIAPIYSSGSMSRYNYDGRVTYSFARQSYQVETYAQLFHNGIVEAVDVALLLDGEGNTNIPSGMFEERIVEAYTTYMATLDKLGIDYPIWLGLSLLGVKGCRMHVDACRRRPTKHTIDRDELIIPEVELKRSQMVGEDVLKPVFDMIWNACGYERSPNYDENEK